jgi:uncharacterized Zn-finger protein
MFGIGGPEAFILFWFIVPGIFGAFIASKKGRDWLRWFLICTFLPIVVILVIFLPPVESKGKFKKCPYCQELVQWGAVICKHCRSELEAEVSTVKADIKICPHCGTKNRAHDFKCWSCSEPI